MNDINQIKETTKQENHFHDCRVSFFDIKDNYISLTFEEDMRTQDNAGAESATYKISNYTDLVVSLDCILPPYVLDIDFENDNTIMFGFTNGWISLKYGDVELTIKRGVK